MKKILASCALIILATAGLTRIAHAQVTDPTVPGHPQVNEVDQRLNDQQNRTDAGVQGGQINSNQEMKDTSRDSRVSNELSRDQAKDGGHITKAQKARMNRQLNRNSKHIHNQRHKPTTPAPVPAPAAPAQ